MIKVTKKDLRTEIKNIIGSLSEDYKKEAGKAIAEAVVHSPSFINAKSVFVYVSTATEPDTSLIISKALKEIGCKESQAVKMALAMKTFFVD